MSLKKRSAISMMFGRRPSADTATSYGGSKRRGKGGHGCTLMIIILLLLAICVWLAWVFYPLQDKEIEQSDTRVIAMTRYVLYADTTEVLAFSDSRADTLLMGITTAQSGYLTDTINAQWVKRWDLLPYSGDCFAVEPYDTAGVARMSSPQLAGLLKRQQRYLATLQQIYGEQRDDVDYYLKTHTITDNGYDIVLRYSKVLEGNSDSISKVVVLVKKALKAKKLQVRLDRKFSFLDTLQHKRLSRLDREAAQERLKVRAAMKPVLKMSAIDSLGTYMGERDSLARPHGYGSFLSARGEFYEGEWLQGKREGVGFSINHGQKLRLGEWKGNEFLGERITYTPERIYGIDISRYQHEQGKKRYKINWNNLRITSLGTYSKKNIEGAVDYPVRFVYIKATEGVTIKNKYFAADYVASKKTGHRTGAYHFFSVRTPGGNQAINFLRNARYSSGDLPPVLDIEPTDKQIREAGGINAMFGNVRKWLATVEKQWHVRPVLYVSQRFVNKYLPQAPDLMKGYDVWIARYGEYKPDVRLLYWQLCQDGRVAGIHGAVDINVFNGFNF